MESKWKQVSWRLFFLFFVHCRQSWRERYQFLNIKTRIGRKPLNGQNSEKRGTRDLFCEFFTPESTRAVFMPFIHSLFFFFFLPVHLFPRFLLLSLFALTLLPPEWPDPATIFISKGKDLRGKDRKQRKVHWMGSKKKMREERKSKSPSGLFSLLLPKIFLVVLILVVISLSNSMDKTQDMGSRLSIGQQEERRVRDIFPASSPPAFILKSRL